MCIRDRLNTVGKGGWTAYQMLFMGDNGETDAAYEALLPLLQDLSLIHIYTIKWYFNKVTPKIIVVKNK